MQKRRKQLFSMVADAEAVIVKWMETVAEAITNKMEAELEAEEMKKILKAAAIEIYYRNILEIEKDLFQ